MVFDSEKKSTRRKTALQRLSANLFFGGCLRMPRCKASEIPRNEAYMQVRRSDEGWSVTPISDFLRNRQV